MIDKSKVKYYVTQNEAIQLQGIHFLIVRNISRYATYRHYVKFHIMAHIRAASPHAFVTDIHSMDQLIAESQAQHHASTLFLSTFGLMALLLVVAGVYSVIAQVVVERRRDLATRSAFGAEPRQVVMTALQSALRPAAIGIGFGGLAALGTTRVLTSILSEVSALDIVTWTETFATLLAACVTAGFVSRRRAARIDPMTALRSE